MERSDNSLQHEGPECLYSPFGTEGQFDQKKNAGKDAGRMAKKRSSKGVDTDRLLSDIKKSFARVSNEGRMTFQQKISFLESVRISLDSEKTALERRHTPQLPTPDSDYPRYPGCGEDALKWLETHWGQYLKYFGADKDYLYQDQLRKLDPELIVAITCGKYKKIIESNGMKIRDIIPRKSDRITEKINRVLRDKKDGKDLLNTYLIAAKRKSRLQKTKSFEIKKTYS